MVRTPRIVDFQQADDPRDAIHSLVQSLAEGSVVGLPTETGYVAAAFSLSAPAAGRLQELSHAHHLGRSTLALRTPQEALDYAPRLESIGRKLTRRFWPGPVTLAIDAPLVGGLVDALPRETRTALSQNDGLWLRLPAHEATASILRLLPAPLLLAGEVNAADASFTSAAALAEGCPELETVLEAGPCRYAQPTTVVRVTSHDWRIEREGVIKERTLRRLAGNVYLFVCTGNTCRSPMAEGLFRKLLADRLKISEDDLAARGYFIASAGMAAGAGSPPSPEAVEILSQRGIDLSQHTSQPVTPELLSQADRVFTMTRGHREHLIHEFPDAADRVQLLTRDGSDVVDPIGAGIDVYRRCADQIERALRGIIAELPIT